MRLEVPYHTVSPSRRPTAFPQLEADIEALRARTWARAQALPTFPHATAHEEASTARATPIKRSRKAAPLPPLKWYQGQNLVAIGVLVVVVYVLATSLVAHYQWFFS
ncbi:MAG: hypothetical protein DI585_06160 [Pseudomonas fluorescens]|nr:MAG: hypothetical protein DI585_06160 [Pseudomonas fluorescens]